MFILAYINVLPIYYIVGLLLIMLIVIPAVKLSGVQWKMKKSIFFTFVAYSAIFAFLFCGPFVGVTEQREYLMTWNVEDDLDDELNQSKVILNYVDFPNHGIYEYSNELASYLKKNGKPEVKVLFEVTLDYGVVRGYHEVKIDELESWNSLVGHGGAFDSWDYVNSDRTPENSPSPWD